MNEAENVRSRLVVCCTGAGAPAGDIDAPPAPWWSVAKTAIAAAALILSDRGKLKLDAPVAGRSFTLRQLLRHDAGLRDYAELPEYLAAVGRNEPPWHPAELLRRVGIDTPAYSPGGGWTYSNAGYLLVRELVEQTTGTDLEAALRNLVFGPAGLEGVRLARTPGDLAASAWGNPDNYHPGWVYHGLFLGTPRDAAQFMHRLMSGRLLPPHLLTMMLERRALDIAPRPERPWRTAGYGLGVMIDRASSAGRAFGHSGEGPGSVCAAYHFPDASPPRTVAAFARGADVGSVERLALETVP